MWELEKDTKINSSFQLVKSSKKYSILLAAFSQFDLSDNLAGPVVSVCSLSNSILKACNKVQTSSTETSNFALNGCLRVSKNPKFHARSKKIQIDSQHTVNFLYLRPLDSYLVQNWRFKDVF